VVATILLLALTVTLFASIFFFVTSFPAPPPQNSNQFQGSIQLASNGSYIKSVSILHLGGPVVPGTDDVYLKGSVQPSYPSFSTPIAISSGIGGASTWNLGQTWTYTFPNSPPSNPQPRLQNVTVYVVSPTQLLYSAVLPGQSIGTPPAIVNDWISPTSPTTGAAYTIYAVFSGSLSSNPTVTSVSATSGLPTTPTAMSSTGLPTNEYSYTASAGATANGTYYAVISGTNGLGTGTAALEFTVVASSSSSAVLSVGVVFVPSPPNSGTLESVQAVVTYTGSVQDAALSVSFAGTSAPSEYTFSGNGPSGLTISGPASETVASQNAWTIPAPNSLYTYTVTATATVTGVGTVNGSASFEPALITLSSTSGIVGATTTVTGSAFSPSTGVTLSVGGIAVTPSSCSSGTLSGGTVTATAAGAFACTIAIPGVASPGANSVLAADASSGQNDSETYTVTAWTLSLSSTSGLVGTTGVTATGADFKGSSSVTLEFAGTTLTPTGGTSCTHSGSTITTSAAGGFACTFTVPYVSASGAAAVVAADSTSGQSATATYTVTAWTLSASGTTTTSATTVTLTAAGFAGSTVVYLSVNGTTLVPASCTTGTVAGSTITVSSTGGLVCTYSAPKVAAAQTTLFEIFDATSNQEAACTFAR
jgi:hypothetical protein